MFPVIKDDALMAYREGLAGFVTVVENAEAQGVIDDPERFASILNLGFTRFGLAANDLARDERISKAAISKWINQKATPAPPTRKTVLNWIARNAHAQLDMIPAPAL